LRACLCPLLLSIDSYKSLKNLKSLVQEVLKIFRSLEYGFKIQ
jgi:hypothetical protein